MVFDAPSSFGACSESTDGPSFFGACSECSLVSILRAAELRAAWLRHCRGAFRDFALATVLAAAAACGLASPFFVST
jgi:hypothetical protein